MSSPAPTPIWSDSSDSSNSLIVEVVDDAVDFEPRPATGVLLELARAEKEKLDQYQREREERLRKEKEAGKHALPPPDATTN